MKTKKLLAAAAALCLCGGILPAASASAEIYGDHNGDGNVDAMDAALILQYAAYAGAGGTQTFYEFVHGSEDGDISSDDGTLTILNCNDGTLSGMIAQYQAAYPNANVEWVQVGEFGGEAAELYATYLLSGKEADLLALIRREMNPMTAMFTGKVRVQGSMQALAKFAQVL